MFVCHGGGAMQRKKFAVLRAFGVLFAFAFVCLVGARQLGAQTVNGSIVGTIKDSQGAAMANATVAAKSQETGAERTTMTDASGGYNIVGLPSGAYDVSVTATGFDSEIQKGSHAHRRGYPTCGFQPESWDRYPSRVEVTGEAPQINTSNATVGGLIDDNSIRQLPLNGRDWLQLALTQSQVVYLTPASGSGGTGAGVKMFISGGRSHAERLPRVDGLVVNDYREQQSRKRPRH